ncbi:MAG: zinc-binding dehydrogenase [Alphaproteobacteria bacterium]
MRSVVATPGAQGSLSIGEAPEPNPDSNEAVIKVACFSLNRGELRRAEAAPAGTQIGWDHVGVIDQPARDGSGPKAGTRVVGFSRRMQGWAEKVAIPTADMAAIPDAVSDADAATLPVAGLTALYSLERCERLLASRVLITGATGGVGYFACQLAKAMGAHVSALARREDQSAFLKDLGVDEVIVSADGGGLDQYGLFRGIIDGVGGPVLGKLIQRLDVSGRVVLYGVSAGPETPLAIRDLFVSDGRVEGLFLYRETDRESASKGLARLLALLADGRLKTHVDIDDSWETIGATAAKLIDRSFPGKAVLRL